jgi:galactose mutarotase-like enzyme
MRRMATHAIDRATRDGIDVEVLTSTAVGGLAAEFAPGAGMIACSLRHRDEELLGQRKGLARYVTERSTMGIPLLHPWANRLATDGFALLGRTVDLELAGARLKRDPSGLPMHGLLTGAPEWEVIAREASPEAAVLRARYDFGADPELVAAFPFPHVLEVEATLSGARLTLDVTVTATGDAPVPVSFGFHPYFRLPGVARAEWEIEAPVREQLLLDERMLPTGERRPVAIDSGPLGARTFDDLYGGVEPGARFLVSGPARRIEVEFTTGYPYAVLYAPADDDVICFEPMTAATNALAGGDDYPVVAPGEAWRATFAVTVGE